jgi:hypothetical protein
VKKLYLKLLETSLAATSTTIATQTSISKRTSINKLSYFSLVEAKQFFDGALTKFAWTETKARIMQKLLLLKSRIISRYLNESFCLMLAA